MTHHQPGNVYACPCGSCEGKRQWALDHRKDDLRTIDPERRHWIHWARRHTQTVRSPTGNPNNPGGRYGPTDDTSPAWDNAVRALEDG